MTSSRPPLEVCILAGGLGTRMGRDKARLRLAGRTMLASVRAVANDFLAGGSSPACLRVIRKDRVPRCGPLGGIVTAFRTSNAPALLFLACDMPLVSARLLGRIMRASHRGERAVFISQRGRVGFPCLLPREALTVVEQQIAQGELSLQSLAKKLDARRLIVSARSRELFNVNTPEDASRAEEILEDRR